MFKSYSIPASERAILIRLIEPASEHSAARTSAHTSYVKLTASTNLGKHSRLSKRLALRNRRAALAQIIEPHFLARPIHARQHLAARRKPHSFDSASATAPAQAQHCSDDWLIA